MTTKWTIKLSNTSPSPNAPHRAELEIELRRAPTVAPHRDIDLAPCDAITELSICALVWFPGDLTRDPSMAGQCVSTIREHFADSEGVAELCDLWKRWHLNGMNAGTRAQRDALEKHVAEHGELDRLDWFGAACNVLRALGLYEDRGYKFGSAWLSEALPADVEARIAELVESMVRS